MLAYIDSNENLQRDADETGVSTPIIIAEVSQVAGFNLSTDNMPVTIPNTTPYPDLIAITTGNFNLDNPRTAAVDLNSLIDIVGGGADGRRGVALVDPDGTATPDRAFARWAQDGMSASDVGVYQGNHLFLWTPADNPGALQLQHMYGQVPMFWPNETAPHILPFPLLDGTPTAGQGRDSSAIPKDYDQQTSSQPLAYGWRFQVRAVDSPSKTFPWAHPAPTFNPAALTQCSMTENYQAFLIVWASSGGDSTATGAFGSRTYAVALEQPWSINATYIIGERQSITPSGTPTIRLLSSEGVVYNPIQSVYRLVPGIGNVPLLVPPSWLPSEVINAQR